MNSCLERTFVSTSSPLASRFKQILSLFRSWNIFRHRGDLRLGRLALTLFVLITLSNEGQTGEPASSAVDFGRDILPILSDKCFQCHGPDAETRKAKLRLDLETDLLRKADPLVIPGRASDSELIQRIISDDDQERMPPPESHLSLKPDQVELLRRWVDSGARWQNHWAFNRPHRPEPPRVARADWPSNPIDRFILAGLEREGLAPSPEASQETLHRRITLDLTGLPPSTAELDAFLGDDWPDAFGRVVDRLLASPRYAERMTTDWLDLARYADTLGYQADRPVAVWPWRDWVVRAFDRNQPFDQFVTWQLAGDLLPQASQEQRLATAFNRLHLQNEEGGIVEEEFRVAYVVDRVNTASTAFLGLTVECARCHDHKFDPITQRDYYSLFAFFQNIDESGQTTFFTQSTPVPTLLLSNPATDAKLDDLSRRIEAAEHLPPAPPDDGFLRWLDAREGPRPEPAGLVGSSPFQEIEPNRPANPGQGLLAVKAVDGPTSVEGKVGRGAELSGENGFTFPGIGHFSKDDPFSIALFVRVPSTLSKAVLVHHSKAPIDAGNRGYEVLLEDGKVAFGLHHMWPGDSVKVVTGRPIPTETWVHVAVTHDGSGRASGMRVYLDGGLAETRVIRDGLVKEITYGGEEPDLAIGYRFRDVGFKGGRVDEFRLFDRAVTPIEVADLAGRPDLRRAWSTPTADLSTDQGTGLLDLYRKTVAPKALKRVANLRELRRERTRLVEATPEAMVMKELDQPKPAYILKRGAYDAPSESVRADTPSALPAFPPDLPRNRLGLARWLFAPDHPLTARVAVNRLWQMMFGRGIVETSENFGRQGTPPTHPELLDWLAVEFVDSGWDVKHMLRLMASSATYRQSSRADPALLARDPSNLLLARGPVRKLSAEMLRDQALAVSGLLDETRGGPPVRPYQPDGLWDVAKGGGEYKQSKGADLHRRSLYTFWKRTVPHPSMMIFDAADRNNCSMRRQSTSTPLQALALLNDPQIVEAARHLAQLAIREGDLNDRGRATWMFRRVLGRFPSPKEADLLARLLAEQRSEFAANRDSALKFLEIGEAKSDPSVDPIELAAASVLAEAILNHDGAVYRR